MKDMTRMNISEKEKREEALARLNLLTKRYNLDPRIKKCFAEGELFYSYMDDEGLVGDIDTIGYDRRYLEEAEHLENRTDCLVYHAIETGNSLALLFVSDYRSDWENERLHGNSLCAYVRDFDSSRSYGEVKYISLDSAMGALVRIK